MRALVPSYNINTQPISDEATFIRPANLRGFAPDQTLVFVEDNQRGQAYPAINDADFAVLPFPLPPLAEQHRIVVKVDELMALCDGLEAALAQADTTRQRLLEALLREALTPALEAVTEAAE